MSAGAGSGGLAASDYSRLRAPAHGGEYPHSLAGGQAPSSLGYAPGSWQSGQTSAAASASATHGGGHRQSGGDNNSSSVGGGYFSGAAAMHGVRGSDQREGQLGTNVWGEGGGGGGGAAARDSIAGGDGGGGRDMWRPPERQTAQAAAAQRGWVTADLANPPRGDFSAGGGSGAAAGGGSLPSIFQMSQQRVGDRPLSNFLSGVGGAAGVAGAGLRGAMGGGGSEAGGAAGWGGGGGFPGDQSVVGGFDHRWDSTASSQLQQQQHQVLGHMISSPRWPDAPGGGAGGGVDGGGMDAGIPRAGSFDHTYGGSATQGRHRGSDGGGGGPEGQA